MQPLQTVSGSVLTRLEALEGKLPAYESLGVQFGALVTEMSTLSSNVKSLTEAMLSTLKQKQDTTQYQSKVDGEKTLASSTPNGKIGKPFPNGSLSPSTKHNGSQKGNGSRASDPQVSERTRSNTRVHSETRSKEIVRPRSPPRLVMTVPRSVPIHVRSSSIVDEDATTVDGGADGSLSPGSDCAFISPPAKFIKVAPKPKKKPVANARGKALAKERALGAEKNSDGQPEMVLTIPPSKKVSISWRTLSLLNS